MFTLAMTLGDFQYRRLNLLRVEGLTKRQMQTGIDHVGLSHAFGRSKTRDTAKGAAPDSPGLEGD